ncbi:MAG: Asp-tRNA(Asn)/Glu-tRNA(Gln) amidotransferase subunit GatB [Candidatus Micrarchaeota archaeon]|nr:Asp-tRNA(Asn)/Glu-tRNA(Gln) amidotransferase subunit GatB [Candidatus Micrarchaeota archaeon]
MMEPEVMIGIEAHVQLNTKSKMFCSDMSEPGDAEPNSNTCPICLGFPGSKPKVNAKAVEHGAMIGLALNSRINEKMFFSRKAYFYPDLSKNYQITQYEIPLASGGFMQLGETKIRIRRVHIEEDPAKLVHDSGEITSANKVLIDYNRAGVPLAEIVTEPDFKNPRQVRQFMEHLSSVLEYLGVYDPKREMSLRVDANISINGGERVEIKNITGFENVEKALSYEVVRQSGITRMGAKVERETRHFNAEVKTTSALRKKEYEEDYGYIFDPDLPMITLTRKFVDSLKANMPELPEQRAARLVKDYKISDYYANVIIYTGKPMADFYEACLKLENKPEPIASWLVNYLLKSLNWRSERIEDSKVKPETFVELIRMIEKGEVTERYAKELMKQYVDTGTSPKKLAAKEKFALSESDMLKIVREIISKNGKAVSEFKSGKGEALQFLIGLVLKETKKQADPKTIKGIIEKEIR